VISSGYLSINLLNVRIVKSNMFEDFYYRGPATTEEEAITRLEQASTIAIDTETVNTNDYTLIGIGLCIGENEVFYFPVFPRWSMHVPLAMAIVSEIERRKIYHNGQGFDLEVLKRFANEEGFEEPDCVNYEDSELLAKICGLPGGLQRAGEEWLGIEGLFSIQDLFKEFNCNNMLDVPEARVAEKCMNDCTTTWKLHHWLCENASERQLDCYFVDRALVPLLRKMQKKGLALRQGVLEEYQQRLEREIFQIRRGLEAEGIENPGSNVQVGFVLASRGNVLKFTKSRKQLQVNEEVLEDIDDPIAGEVLEYRRRTKLLSTYILPWLGKERAYTHFRLDLATGRLASGRINNWDGVNRNLQNIPPDVREVFRPDTGTWSWADHGQIELRVLAYMSKDKLMLEEYAKADPDLHSITAKAGGVPRSAGKTFNFAMVYGASNKMLARRTGVRIERIQGMREAWAELYPEAKRWIDNKFFNHNGEWVESEFGRRMRLPEMSENAEYNEKAFAAHIGKCAVNYPIQGTAADIVKRGMLLLDRLGADLRLQLHDEYLVDGDYDFPEELVNIHPELRTPFEQKKGLVWS
jgi:DNA polymerase I-like protein with 3'-5' exonuclease and polymerase domains